MKSYCGLRTLVRGLEEKPSRGVAQPPGGSTLRDRALAVLLHLRGINFPHFSLLLFQFVHPGIGAYAVLLDRWNQVSAYVPRHVGVARGVDPPFWDQLYAVGLAVLLP